MKLADVLVIGVTVLVLIAAAAIHERRLNRLETQLRANGHQWMCQLTHDVDHPDDPRYDHLWCEHPDSPYRTEATP